MLGSSNFFQIPGPLSQPQFNTKPDQAQSDTNYYNPSYIQRDERRFNRQVRFGTVLRHSFNDENIISASAYVNPKYLQRSERNTFRDFTRYHLGGNIVYGQTMKIFDNAILTSTLGADEAYQDGAILFYKLKNGLRDSILADDKKESANSFGAFIQEDVAVNNFNFSFGGRFDRITYSYEDYLNPSLGDQKSFTRFSPKLGFIYRRTPLHSFYVSYGSGVEVPAGNETDPAAGQVYAKAINPLLEPIVSTTYEIGTKHDIQLNSELLLQHVFYEVTAYFISVVNDIVPYQNGRFYLMAGKSSRKGIEASFSVLFKNGLSLRSSLTLSRNTYDDYKIDSVFTQRPINISLSGKYVHLSNNSVAGIPGIMYHTTLHYDVPFISGMFAETSLHSIGQYYADDKNSLLVQSYSLINAALGYVETIQFLNNLNMHAAITINNLTNKQYAASAYINPDYGRTSLTLMQAIYLESGLPRNVTATIGLTYNFDK